MFFVYFNFYIFGQQTRKQKILNWMVASITRIPSALNFLVDQILIGYCCSQIFKFATFSKDLLAVSYICS
jgi:hypothetical protein